MMISLGKCFSAILILAKSIIISYNYFPSQQCFISHIENTLRDCPDNDLTLDIIDYIMDNGGYQIIYNISSKDFLNIFASIVLPTSQALPSIQSKVLYLISKWGNRFDSNMNNPFPTFKDLYHFLLSQGIIFPQNLQSTYYKYTDINYIQYQQQSIQNQDKLNKVTEITNLWITKLTEINQMIDQGRYGIHFDRLKIEMFNLNNWKLKVNSMIGEYYEQSNIREIFISLKRDIDLTALRYDKLMNSANSNNNELQVPYVSSFEQFNNQNMNQPNNGNNFYAYYSFDKFDKNDFNAKKYPFDNPKLDGKHIKEEMKEVGEKIKKPFDKAFKDMNQKFGNIKCEWDNYDPNQKNNKNLKHGYVDNMGHQHEHKPFLVKMKKGFNDIKESFEKIGKKH